MEQRCTSPVACRLAGSLFAATFPGLALFASERPPLTPDLSWRYPVMTAPLIPTAPTVDGTVGKAEWTTAAQSLPFVLLDGGAKTDDTAVLWVGYTRDAFHLAFRFDRPAYAGEPRAQTKPNGAWRDDSLELFLQTTPGAADFNFVVNSLGIGGDGRRTSHTDKTWDGEWDKSARRTDTGWEGELSIPFRTLGVQTPAAGATWRILAVRNRKTPKFELGASSFIRSWYAKQDYGYLVFGSPGTPAIRVLSAGALNTVESGAVIEAVSPRRDATLRVEAALYQPHVTQPGALSEKVETHEEGIFIHRQVALNFFQAIDKKSLKSARSQYRPIKTWALAAAKVPANRTRRYPMAVKTGQGKMLLRYRVLDADTGALLSGGSLPFEQKPAFEVDARPYVLVAQVVGVSADYRRVAELAEGSEVTAELLDQSTKKSLARVKSPVDMKARRTLLRLPTEGRFGATLTLETRLVGGNGNVLSEDTREIILPSRPDWLDNQLGSDAGVLPWWSPIAVAGDLAKVILREYRLGASGLPAGIVSKGRRLLARPIELLLRGERLSWKKTQERKTDRDVVWISRARQKGLALTMKSTLEYDGLIRYDLTLDPGGRDTALQNLVLSIPYRSEMAVFGREQVHQNFTPRGEIGDYETGLFWFCEWAKGWQIGEQPAMEVKPKGEVVDWRIRFIGKEGKTIREPLTFTFGLQALPVRRMDYSYQYDARRCHYGAPPLEGEDAKFTLRYRAEGNVPVDEGSLAFSAIITPRPVSTTCRLVRFGKEGESLDIWYDGGRTTRYVPTLFLRLADKNIAKIEPIHRVRPWNGLALSWKQADGSVDLTMVAVDPLGKTRTASGSIPHVAWQKALAADEVVFGGVASIAVDNIVVSRKAHPAPVLATLLDRPVTAAGKITLADPLDDIRLSRGLYRTRPMVIQNGKGGIAGARYTASFVKKIDGRFGSGLLLPAADEWSSEEVLKSFGYDITFPHFDQWAKISGFYGSCFFEDPIYQKCVKSFRRAGLGVMFYGNLALDAKYEPHLSPYMKELVTVPEKKCGTVALNACANSPAVDFYLWEWKRCIDYYDMNAVHMDNTINCRSECKNLFHGCGWYDEVGALRGRYPIFGAREFAKRVNWLFHLYIKDGWAHLHAGARGFAPVGGFADLHQMGEGGGFTSSTWEELILPEQFGLSYAHRFGVPVEILTKRNKHRFGPNYLYLYAMLYNMTLRSFGAFTSPEWWHVNPDAKKWHHMKGAMDHYDPYFVRSGIHDLAIPQALWWMLKDEFGTRIAEFRPFWSNQDYVQFNHPMLRTSFYLHPGRDVLFIVCNFGQQSANARMKLDLKAMRLDGKKLQAYDAFTDDEYEIDGSVVTLILPAKCYRLVRLDKAEG